MDPILVTQAMKWAMALIRVAKVAVDEGKPHINISELKTEIDDGEVEQLHQAFQAQP